MKDYNNAQEVKELLARDLKDKKGIWVDVLRLAGRQPQAQLSDKIERFLMIGDNVPQVSKAEGIDPFKVLVYKVDESKSNCLTSHRSSVIHTVNDYCVPYTLNIANVWTMFSGNFVYSSDSRFYELSRSPIKIHDRVEK